MANELEQLRADNTILRKKCHVLRWLCAELDDFAAQMVDEVDDEDLMLTRRVSRAFEPGQPWETVRSVIKTARREALHAEIKPELQEVSRG